VNVLFNKGCSELQVDLPVPEPDEDQVNPIDDEDNQLVDNDEECSGKNCSGASHLALNAIASLTLAAFVL